METKISPIGYEEFRLKYILKNEAPVRGSDEMLSLDGYLNRLIWGLTVIIAIPISICLTIICVAAI